MKATSRLLILIVLTIAPILGAARTKITAVRYWHYRINNGNMPAILIDTVIYYRSGEGVITDSVGNPSIVLYKKIKTELIDSTKTKIHRRDTIQTELFTSISVFSRLIEDPIIVCRVWIQSQKIFII